MKFSDSWLRAYLKTNASINEIADKMTQIGIEVEGIQDNATALKGFIVGEIRTLKKHPNADRLNVLTVWTGTEELQVVCGAPNCFIGMKSVLALPGVMIPKFQETLEKGTIRGITSNGMLCAEDELCLGSDHTGIIDLKTDLPAGTPFIDILKPDIIFDVEITPNRPDCYGVKGIARDLSSTGIGEYVDELKHPVNGTFTSPISVLIQDSHCECFVLRYIKGVQNTQSPAWMQKRLISAGLHPISHLVDVTNYLNIQECRPLHVFDADKITGNLVVRSAKEGEKITCLDGKTYDLHEGMMVVADDKGPQSIAGIMGGIDTSCDRNTKNIVIESAYFDPLSIAITGQKTNALSDSRTRFERGVDPCSCIAGNEEASRLIMEVCGGEASKLFIAGQEHCTPIVINFDFGFVKRLCNIEIPRPEMERILKALGFLIEKNCITVPSWRSIDVTRPADIVEEIIRIHGLSDLPAKSVRPDVFRTQMLKPHQRLEFSVRRALANAGLYQAITWSFMNSKLAKHFNSKGITLQNPIASDLDEMRPSLVPNLLSAVKRNIDRGQPNVQLFEVGPEFLTAEPNGQRLVACAVRSGENHARHWKDSTRFVDCFDAKSDALIALMAANAPPSQISKNVPSWYHPGRSGSFNLGKSVLAVFGEIHPAILALFGIKETVVACEVYLENIPSTKAKNKPMRASSLMPLSRDFAFVMDSSIESLKLVSSIYSTNKELITDVRVFDIYEGDKLPRGKKSIAVEVVIQPTEKTLTDIEIEAISQQIIFCVKKNTGAELRTQ